MICYLFVTYKLKKTAFFGVLRSRRKVPRSLENPAFVGVFSSSKKGPSFGMMLKSRGREPLFFLGFWFPLLPICSLRAIKKAGAFGRCHRGPPLWRKE